MTNIGILGATGLVGSLFLDNILQDSRIDRVYTFGRRKTGVVHSKLVEIESDLFQLNDLAISQYQLSSLCCCIGTTAKKTPDKSQYRKIDLGIPMNAAKLCEANNIPNFQVISAMGANANSKIFYNRIKGEMENAVLSTKIMKTYILQPSLIVGPRKERRLGERLAGSFMKYFSFLFAGPLKNYSPIKASEIAQAMQNLLFVEHPSGRINSTEIKKVASL
ncbi:nucleoside-diphosphate sugar epimerase [Flavobacteriaceae bacterium]|nr:nucleoside-diphosphate sugar epimerase [Flavobacteriaceae bacterium]